MTQMEPLAAVRRFSSLAALTATLGSLPLALGVPPSRQVIGWANALAGGLMIGVAYTLLHEGLGGALAAGGSGTLVGIVFVRATHTATGTGELDLERPEGAGADYSYKALLVDSLHAADEGVAIGVAMVVSEPLGIAMAAALAVHNVPEAMVLNSVLTSRGMKPSRSSFLSVVVNVNQVLLAIVTFTLVGLWPWLLPLVAGFAVGALIYRALVELLPESYRQAGQTSIAVVTLLAIGVVVLLAGVAI